MSGTFDVKVTREDDTACLELSGVIDERFDPSRILDELAPITILDVSEIRRITSFGVRQWTDTLKSIPSDIRQVYLVRCPSVFVDQLNMVLNFAGRAQIISANALYVCDQCNHEQTLLLDFFGDRAQLAAGQIPTLMCPQCKTQMSLADDPQSFARLVSAFGAKAIEPTAAALLARAHIYTVKDIGRAAQATKLVHGQVTLLQLVGVLDDRFRPRRLASGVEGDVVFDLGEVEGADAAGATRWGELLGGLSAASSITLVDVAEELLAPIVEGRFSVDGTIIHSLRARFRCEACESEERQPVRSHESFAHASRPCGRCGQPMALSTDPALLDAAGARAPGSSRIPAGVEEVIAVRHELLARARAESGVVGPASASDSLARYRVIKPLTEGGMAEIFLAVHQGIAGFEKLIALKKIRRKLLERRQVAVTMFLNEAKIAANLNHPNIVQVFEVGEHGGDLFIAMEYIHGINARQLLQTSILKNMPVSVEQVLYIAEQVAAGLHHAHTARDLSGRSLSIVHRDVSPSNIAIGFDGQVKLLDFGVATAAVGESVDGLIGKFSYMSPEQVQQQPLDGRSDVFSLGVVMYELLARKTLFRRNSDDATLKAVLNAEVPSFPAGVPPFVESLIRTATARRAEDRFPDARALQFAAAECLRTIGSTISGQRFSDFIKEMFPDRSATPPIDPATYRSGSASGPIDIDIAGSPSASYRPGEDGVTLRSGPRRTERSMAAIENTASTVAASRARLNNTFPNLPAIVEMDADEPPGVHETRPAPRPAKEPRPSSDARPANEPKLAKEQRPANEPRASRANHASNPNEPRVATADGQAARVAASTSRAMRVAPSAAAEDPGLSGSPLDVVASGERPPPAPPAAASPAVSGRVPVLTDEARRGIRQYLLVALLLVIAFVVVLVTVLQ